MSFVSKSYLTFMESNLLIFLVWILFSVSSIRCSTCFKFLPNNLFQFSSVAQSCPTLCNPMSHSTPGFPVHHQLPESTQTHVHWVGDTIQPSHPLPSPSPPALKLSQHQGLFQWISSSHQVTKVLDFQLQLSPSNEHPGLISFRMDWLDLLAVRGTLKSLLQHHSSKASVLRVIINCTVFSFQLLHISCR